MPAFAAVEHQQTAARALLAAAHAHAGRIEGARDERAHLRKIWPAPSLSTPDGGAELCGKAMSGAARSCLREGLKLARPPA